MRSLFLPLLLASVAAVPVGAAPRDDTDREQARAERQEARESRRAERSEERAVRSEPSSERVEQSNQPAERVERAGRAERAERIENRAQVETRANAEARSNTRAQGSASQRDLEQIRAARDADRAQRTEQRTEQRKQLDARRAQHEADTRANVIRRPAPVVSDTPRPGTQPPVRVDRPRNNNPVKWNSDWRRDNRYNWKNHRNRYRWIYNLGHYYDPYGWRYYPYQVGWRLWPSYYSSRYWINDPWYYRLPYAPPGYRWVRYWDDAVLVDTWSGQVVDVIYNFFW